MTIKWLKMCYSGVDMGAEYEITNEYEGFLFFYDDYGRQNGVHRRYDGLLFVEVKP